MSIIAFLLVMALSYVYGIVPPEIELQLLYALGVVFVIGGIRITAWKK